MHGTHIEVLDPYVEMQLKKISPQKVVDFGAGEGKYGDMIRKLFGDKCIIIAIEGYKPTVNFLKEKSKYNFVFEGHIQQWVKSNCSHFDVAIFGDVLEHLTKIDIFKILDSAVRYFRYIIICVSLQDVFQDSVDGNPLEIHRTYITEDFFDKYNIIEKHIVKYDKYSYKMNALIDGYKKHRLKKAVVDFLYIQFGRNATKIISFFKKIKIK